MNIKVGDKVITSKYSGTEIKYEGEEYIIVKESDILAIVEQRCYQGFKGSTLKNPAKGAALLTTTLRSEGHWFAGLGNKIWFGTAR